MSDDGLSFDKSTRIAQKLRLSNSPALAQFKDKMFCAYQGSGKDGDLHYSWTSDGENWEDDRKVKDSGISGSPALAVFKDRLYCAHQWSGQNGNLWYTATSDGVNWDSYDDGNAGKKIGRISDSPSLAVFKDKLFVAYQGSWQDGNLYTNFTTDGKTWSEAVKIPDIHLSCSPSLAVFNGTLYCAFQGSGQNGKLYYISTTDGVNWKNSGQISQAGISESPSLKVFNGRLYCAHQWSGQNGNLWYISTTDGVTWSGYRNEKVGGLSESPSLEVFKDFLYFSYQGSGQSGNLWYSRAGYSTVTSTDVVAIIKKAYPTLTIQSYNSDTTYQTIFSSTVDGIYERSELKKDKYIWKKERFDCDDFAIVFKGDVSKWTYTQDDSGDRGAAFGFMWGVNKDGSSAHAYNFYITPNHELKLIEPQNGKTIPLSDWNPYLAVY